MSMPLYYLSILIVYMLLWGCCVVFMLPLKFKSHFKARMATGTFIWLLLSVLACYIQSRFHVQTIVWLICGSLLCVGLFWFLCNERKSTKVYCSIWAMLVAEIIVQLWDVVWLVSGKEEIWYFLPVWAFICLLIIRKTLAQWLPGPGGYDVGPRKLTLSGVTFLAFEFCIIFLEREGAYILLNTRNLLLMVVQLYCITILYMQNALFQKSAMQSELNTMNLLWKQQKDQYELSKENIALINRKCHDLKHQIAAIRVMGSSEERDKYIKELQKTLNIYDSVVRTGNEVLDTILTEKSLYCEANDIKINCIVDGKQMDFLDSVDLYTIIGNALDNAIESVQHIQEQDKRIIDVLVYVKQKFLVINITNPLDHEVQFEDGVPVSTKERNGYHGFGTKSIRHTVQKYNGHTSFQVENGCFSLKILFPTS